MWVLTRPVPAHATLPGEHLAFSAYNLAPRTRCPLLPSCFVLRLKSTLVTPSLWPLKCLSSEGSSWGRRRSSMRKLEEKRLSQGRASSCDDRGGGCGGLTVLTAWTPKGLLQLIHEFSKGVGTLPTYKSRSF